MTFLSRSNGHGPIFHFATEYFKCRPLYCLRTICNLVSNLLSHTLSHQYRWVNSILVRIRQGTIGSVPNISGTLQMAIGRRQVTYFLCDPSMKSRALISTECGDILTDISSNVISNNHDNSQIEFVRVLLDVLPIHTH